MSLNFDIVNHSGDGQPASVENLPPKLNLLKMFLEMEVLEHSLRWIDGFLEIALKVQSGQSTFEQTGGNYLWFEVHPDRAIIGEPEYMGQEPEPLVIPLDDFVDALQRCRDYVVANPLPWTGIDNK